MRPAKEDFRTALQERQGATVGYRDIVFAGWFRVDAGRFNTVFIGEKRNAHISRESSPEWCASARLSPLAGPADVRVPSRRWIVDVIARRLPPIRGE